MNTILPGACATERSTARSDPSVRKARIAAARSGTERSTKRQKKEGALHAVRTKATQIPYYTVELFHQNKRRRLSASLIFYLLLNSLHV